MPSLDPRFVLMQPLQDYFIDKDSGFPLSAGVVTFYEDDGSGSSSVLKPIYELSLSPSNEYIYTQLNNPVTLTSIGTFADDDGNDILPYLYPYQGLPTDTFTGPIELYYITVDSSGGVRQFTRSAFPNISSTPSPEEGSSSTNNELSNPQFVEVSFSPLTDKIFTISGATTIEIAPSWFIDATGSGTITVSRLDITDEIPSNPPFSLKLQCAGSLTGNVFLRQRLDNSPRLFADGYVSGYFIAASNDSSAHLLTLTYDASNGQSEIICSGSTTTNNLYNEITGTVSTSGITNNDPGSTGYIDVTLTIPTTCNINLSSFQISGVQQLNSVSPFSQESTARQKDHLFHYYEDSIIIQPKDSILVGWDFSLNPWQFSPKAVTNFPYTPGTIGYCADQTIIKTEIANSILVGKAIGNPDAGYLEIVARGGVTQGQIAVIQYIDKYSAAPYFNNILSSLVRIRMQAGAISTIRFKMRLITSATTPATLAAGEPITGWDLNKNPIFSAQWLAIAPQNDPIYVIGDSIPDNAYVFNNFVLPSYDTMRYMGVVLYTLDPLDNNVPDILLIRNVSLVPNEFAIDVNPKTYDQVLRECEFYYEKTYLDGNIAGAATAVGSLYAIQNLSTGLSTDVLPKGFGASFCTEKCITPTLTFYSVAGTINTVTAHAAWNLATVFQSGSGDTTSATTAIWDQSVSTTSFANTVKPAFNYASIFHIATAGTSIYEGWINYHYTADSRLGQ